MGRLVVALTFNLHENERVFVLIRDRSPPTIKVPLRLGTRASALAQWQAGWVAARLREQGHKVELIHITTEGDKTQGPTAQSSEGAPISGLGGVGVFTKELQRALLDNRIDLAVHSLKDLPTDKVEGLSLAAVPERESVFDVLVGRQGHSLEQLPHGLVVGTGSLRRRAQLLYVRPDLRMADVRGNVDTRLRKLREGQFDALVLAEAGLRRLGLTAAITQVLPTTLMLPAVGQGALGIETRGDDAPTLAAVRALDHRDSHIAVIAERTLLMALSGGCLAPIGAWARLTADQELHLSAVVLASDGSERIEASSVQETSAAEALGMMVASALLSQGADRLISTARR